MITTITEIEWLMACALVAGAAWLGAAYLGVV